VLEEQNTPEQFEKTFREGAKNLQVYLVLKDQEWHCRECEYAHTGITQIAGGSGIQGLQRGTSTRSGIDIKSDNRPCATCGRTTRQDRWNGAFHSAIVVSGMSKKFVDNAWTVLGKRDIVENVQRPIHELTIDHKLPMLRWDSENAVKQTQYNQMSDQDIRHNFQLLKKSNGSVSHNLLKSRACESCLATRQRGTPFGINFFYRGGTKWEPSDEKDPDGCVGCGWYDFGVWRDSLNEELRTILDTKVSDVDGA
jgi:hypothetical protein